MSLREEMARYEQLTGESAEPITINRLGAYLDGVDKGIEELKKIKAEIKVNARGEYDFEGYCREEKISIKEVNKIIDNHIAELKGEN